MGTRDEELTRGRAFWLAFKEVWWVPLLVAWCFVGHVHWWDALCIAIMSMAWELRCRVAEQSMELTHKRLERLERAAGMDLS